MPKITARGSVELARRKTPYGTYVLRSDGAILFKSSVPRDGYTVVGQITGNAATFIRVFSNRVGGDV